MCHLLNQAIKKRADAPLAAGEVLGAAQEKPEHKDDEVEE